MITRGKKNNILKKEKKKKSQYLPSSLPPREASAFHFNCSSETLTHCSAAIMLSAAPSRSS